jgi:hypothetical protein
MAEKPIKKEKYKCCFRDDTNVFGDFGRDKKINVFCRLNCICIWRVWSCTNVFFSLTRMYLAILVMIVAQMFLFFLQVDMYRLRNFAIEGKRVVNRGDSLKARSNHSINSTGSR